jgi:hypothetical protein
MTATPVKILADTYGVPVFQPEKLRGTFIDDMRQQQFDVLICSAYGKIFGPTFLSLFKKGTVNIHPSLLPRFRGAAPIPAAMLKYGDTVSVCQYFHGRCGHFQAPSCRSIGCGKHSTHLFFSNKIFQNGQRKWRRTSKQYFHYLLLPISSCILSYVLNNRLFVPFERWSKNNTPCK